MLLTNKYGYESLQSYSKKTGDQTEYVAFVNTDKNVFSGLQLFSLLSTPRKLFTVLHVHPFREKATTANVR